ncbi:MAG: CCA tRNA nucleotidyltransferase [Candidatus Thermoplasmatota archaeon]|jgi:tRNA nucleotidyltransferase (CCA-adding enzyme)
MTPLEREILGEVTPSDDEQAALDSIVRDLVARCDAELAAAGLPGKAGVQGSVAKGTWLRGGTDIDLFLLLDPSVPQDRLEAVALQVGPKVLEECQKKYAQHPYLTGSFKGHAVDLVPAYAVPEAGAKMSAVDRTPFHTAWVRAHLGDHKRAQVRLLKRWMKGTGVYGAQTAIGGFSGYLVEVLIARFLSFDGVLLWLSGGAQPRRIALGPDQVKDDVSQLVVVDPVDPARNCAAAVNLATLELAIAAAKAYRAAPGRRFFFPNPPRVELPATLQAALSAQEASWTGALVRPKSKRLDIVFPQFQRAARTLETGLANAGFTVRRLDVAVSDDESEVLLQFVCAGEPLPSRRMHTGPIDDGRPNATRFREKWDGHADALTPVHTGPDGKLQVALAIRLQTPAQWLAARLPLEPLGRHVQDALEGHQTFADPAEVPAAWAARVADVVLDRKAWDR